VYALRRETVDARPFRASAGWLYAGGVHSKEEVRERIWSLLEREGAARFPGARGRIPDFRGAEQAAVRLAELPAWQAASVVKANPDGPQLSIRRRAGMDGKMLYTAVPRCDRDSYDDRPHQLTPASALNPVGRPRSRQDRGRPCSKRCAVAHRATDGKRSTEGGPGHGSPAWGVAVDLTIVVRR